MEQEKGGKSEDGRRAGRRKEGAGQRQAQEPPHPRPGIRRAAPGRKVRRRRALRSQNRLSLIRVASSCFSIVFEISLLTYRTYTVESGYIVERVYSNRIERLIHSTGRDYLYTNNLT